MKIKYLQTSGRITTDSCRMTTAGKKKQRKKHLKEHQGAHFGVDNEVT
jgi:hypothetical protein